MSNLFWFLLIIAIAPALPYIIILGFFIFLYCVPIIWSETFGIVGSIVYWLALTALLIWYLWWLFRQEQKELENLKEKGKKESQKRPTGWKGGAFLLSFFCLIPIAYLLANSIPDYWGRITVGLILCIIIFWVWYISKDEKKSDSLNQ